MRKPWLLILIAGCTSVDASSAAQEQPKPRQQIVAFDISASRTNRERLEARQFAERIVADLRNGDAIEMLQVHDTGLRDSAKHWSAVVPSAKDPTNPKNSEKMRIDRVRKGARLNIGILLGAPKGAAMAHTDLLATLFRVSDIVRDRSGRESNLYLLSDMLQSTAELNMERGMPPSNWVPTREAEGRIPNLRGVCVVVIGADASSAGGIAVRRFWQAFFTAAGAQLLENNYRNSAESVQQLHC